jgi:hypothetical protein
MDSPCPTRDGAEASREQMACSFVPHRKCEPRPLQLSLHLDLREVKEVLVNEQEISPTHATLLVQGGPGPTRDKYPYPCQTLCNRWHRREFLSWFISSNSATSQGLQSANEGQKLNISGSNTVILFFKWIPHIEQSLRNSQNMIHQLSAGLIHSMLWLTGRST